MTPEEVAKVRELLTHEDPDIQRQGLELAKSFGDYSAVFEGCSISDEGRVRLTFGPLNRTIWNMLQQSKFDIEGRTPTLDLGGLGNPRAEYVLPLQGWSVWTQVGQAAQALTTRNQATIYDGQVGDRFLVAIVNEDDCPDLIEELVHMFAVSYLGKPEQLSSLGMGWVYGSYGELCTHPLAEDYGDYVIFQGDDKELRTLLADQASLLEEKLDLRDAGYTFPVGADKLFIISHCPHSNWLDAKPDSGADPLTSLAFVEVIIVSDDE